MPRVSHTAAAEHRIAESMTRIGVLSEYNKTLNEDKNFRRVASCKKSNDPSCYSENSCHSEYSNTDSDASSALLETKNISEECNLAEKPCIDMINGNVISTVNESMSRRATNDKNYRSVNVSNASLIAPASAVKREGLSAKAIPSMTRGGLMTSSPIVLKSSKSPVLLKSQIKHKGDALMTGMITSRDISCIRKTIPKNMSSTPTTASSTSSGTQDNRCSSRHDEKQYGLQGYSNTPAASISSADTTRHLSTSGITTTFATEKSVAVCPSNESTTNTHNAACSTMQLTNVYEKTNDKLHRAIRVSQYEIVVAGSNKIETTIQIFGDFGQQIISSDETNTQLKACNLSNSNDSVSDLNLSFDFNTPHQLLEFKHRHPTLWAKQVHVHKDILFAATFCGVEVPIETPINSYKLYSQKDKSQSLHIYAERIATQCQLGSKLDAAGVSLIWWRAIENGILLAMNTITGGILAGKPLDRTLPAVAECFSLTLTRLTDPPHHFFDMNKQYPLVTDIYDEIRSDYQRLLPSELIEYLLTINSSYSEKLINCDVSHNIQELVNFWSNADGVSPWSTDLIIKVQKTNKMPLTHLRYSIGVAILQNDVDTTASPLLPSSIQLRLQVHRNEPLSRGSTAYPLCMFSMSPTSFSLADLRLTYLRTLWTLRKLYNIHENTQIQDNTETKENTQLMTLENMKNTKAWNSSVETFPSLVYISQRSTSRMAKSVSRQKDNTPHSNNSNQEQLLSRRPSRKIKCEIHQTSTNASSVDSKYMSIENSHAIRKLSYNSSASTDANTPLPDSCPISHTAFTENYLC